VHGVLDARLLLLHFDLGGGTDLDHRNAPDQLGEPFLQLFAVVVRGRLFNLGANLLDPAFDVGLLSAAINDGRVVLVDGDPLGSAEVGERHVFQNFTELLGDHLAAGDRRDVLEHCFAAVPESAP
jgi:hypothetical protein